MIVLQWFISLLIGIFIGVVICIPVGPINVWVVSTFMKKGKAMALSLAAGGALMDFVYFALSLFGQSKLTVPASFTKIIYGLSTLLILMLGIKELFSKVEFIQETNEIKGKGLLGAFLFGIFLYVSNPTLLLSINAIVAFLKSISFLKTDVFLCIGIALGSFSWFSFLIFMASKYKEQLREKYMGIFTKVSGVLMIACGLFLALKL